MNRNVLLKKKEGRTLNAGGLWVFDNEIDSMDEGIGNGDIVNVLSVDGHFFGQGYFNNHSKIVVRLLTRKREDINRDFFYHRLKNAWNYRKSVIDTSCCRIVFGDADFLPGLTVDKYADILVFEALSLGIDQRKDELMQLLVKILEEDHIHIRGICERSDAKVRELEGLQRYKGYMGEPFDPLIQIEENGIKMQIDVYNGQKTGYFLDQKWNRAAIRPYVKDKKVLDCFCNLGGFALNAGMGGAREVIGLDASQLAVDSANYNARLNHLEDRVHFECTDVFAALPQYKENGETFDAIILDPPAFTKSRSSLKNALKGYREINTQAMRLLKDGGFLFTCSCSEFLTEDLFRKVITEAGKVAKKRIRQVEFRTQSADHPIFWGSNTSYYLKFAILQISEE